MTAKFIRWIVFMTILITHDAAKSETIKGQLSTGATHHRIVIVVPTEIRHVNHIHHFPLKGHKSGTNPRYIYYKIPLGSIKPYLKCNGDHRHSGKGKPVQSSGYNPDSTTPGPKVNGYNDNKNTIDYQDKPTDSGGPAVTSQENNGYYDDSYSDQGPTPVPSPGPPYYDSPRYSDPRPTDPPPPPPPYINDINRYSYNGHGGAGSGSFPGTGLGHNIRFGKYFHDFGSRPNRNKHTSSFNHGFKSSTTGSGFDYGYPGSPGRYKHTEKIKIIVPHSKRKFKGADFPYRFSHEKKNPIRNYNSPNFGPIRSVESPVETNYNSFNGNDKNVIPPSVYTSPNYDDNYDKPVGSEGGKETDPYDYPNTEVGPNEFNDNFNFVHESDELKAELGLTSEEAENFPSAEYPSDPPKVNADGPLQGHVTSTLSPIQPSQPDPLHPPEISVTDFPYFNSDDTTPTTPTDDFSFFKDFDKPKKKVKYVSYVNGPFSGNSGPPPNTSLRDKNNDVKIEKQNLIRLQPIVTSGEFNRPPFTTYDKVIGHGRAMYEANSDFKFDSHFDGKYEEPFEPHRLQSKMVGKGVPPQDNNGGPSGRDSNAHQKSPHSNVHQSPVTNHQSSVTNLKDRIHQIHGYVPKEEPQTITLIKTSGN